MGKFHKAIEKTEKDKEEFIVGQDNEYDATTILNNDSIKRRYFRIFPIIKPVKSVLIIWIIFFIINYKISSAPPINQSNLTFHFLGYSFVT